MSSIVFDFDFTLADSSAGVVDSANHAFGRLGLPLRSAGEIRATIGLSLHATLETLQGPQSGEVAECFARIFAERADSVMVPGTRLYDAVPEVFRVLRARGYRLGIVSTKFRRRIEEVLGAHGLADAVDLIVGGEDTPVHKPDPTGLVLARRGLLGDDRPAVYVGDHPVDAQAARAAGFEFVAVLTGVHGAGSFAELQPLTILDTVAELPRAIAAAPHLTARR